MTNEERDLITQFVCRTGGRPTGAGGFAGSVPNAGGPPVDPEADALLADLFNRFPEARYRITQFAFVQEHAVAAATNQIQQLQAQIQQMQQQMQAQQAPAPQASPWGAAAQAAPSRGIFGGLFGGGQPAPQPQYPPQAYAPPPPQYAPGYQPGMFQRGGSGFLGSALTTAAGVAGGMMAANALSNLFSGGHHDSYGTSFGGGGFGGGGFAPQQGTPAEASPWASAPAADPNDQGGDAKSYPAPDQTAWNTPDPAPDSGWQDASAGDSGDSGWSDSGGSDSDNS
jgi:hypothetical protein